MSKILKVIEATSKLAQNAGKKVQAQTSAVESKIINSKDTFDFLKAKGNILKANIVSGPKEKVKVDYNHLERYRPTVCEGSQVPMHHDINGHNSNIRYVINHLSIPEEKLSRSDRIKRENSLARIKEYDEAFQKLVPTEKPYVVYRGRTENTIIERFNYDFKIMEEAKVGEIVTPDKGYSYCAFNKSLADNWGFYGKTVASDDEVSRALTYEIHIPQGAKVSRNLEHGGEVVMPRNAHYLLKNKKVSENGDIYAILEYILPNK